jgi:hypothetical protein
VQVLLAAVATRAARYYLVKYIEMKMKQDFPIKMLQEIIDK